MTRPGRDAFDGPALLSAGFRPFFLLALLFGLAVVPAWMAVREGRLALGGPFAPPDWHAHEMIWGYGGAAIAGFLFTAVPNWTGRMPTRGRPLAALALLWLAGRLAVAGLLPLGPLGVMAVDAGFLLAVGALIGREIVAGRNWRNLVVLVPVLVLLAANVLFHLEARSLGAADAGRRLGLSVVVVLVTLIGGRIVPSFTRNWLAQRGAARLPVPAGRFDGLCVAAGATALALWSAAPGRAAGTALAVAGLLHAARLARWRGWATARSPLLLMLHLAYGFVPAGLLATGLAGWGLGAEADAVHLLGIGAIGGMTAAVMMRATLGHTGRPLVAGPLLTAAFALVGLAALLRALLPWAEAAGVTGLGLAAALWTAGFALALARVAPWLVAPKAAARRPNP